MTQTAELAARIQERVSSVFVGKETQVELILTGLILRPSPYLEGVFPAVAGASA